MSNKTDLRPGDRVRVVQWVYRDGRPPDLGDTVYEVRTVDGYLCEISEVGKDGRLYKPQTFDTELLWKAA